MPTIHFTRESARIAGLKSAQGRKQRQAEREARIAAFLSGADDPAPKQGISLKQIESHLETLNLRLAGAKTNEDLDVLTRSYDRLFNVWTVLRKIDDPSSRRFKAWTKTPLPGTTPGPAPDPGPVVSSVVVSSTEPDHKPSLEPTQDTQKANESIG